MKAGVGLFVIVLYGFILSSFAAENLVIDINSAPQFVFQGRNLQLRLNVYKNYEPPQKKVSTLTKTPATISFAFFAKVKTDELTLSGKKNIQLYPYNDRTQGVHFSIPAQNLKAGSRIEFTLKAGGVKVLDNLFVYSVLRPPSDLRVKGYYLYTQGQSRVVLRLRHWSDSKYRRWAGWQRLLLPLNFPVNSTVIVLTCSEDKNDFLAKLKLYLLKRHCQLRIVRPLPTAQGSEPGAPILRLLAAFAKVKPEGALQTLICPGREDLFFGTPQDTFFWALQAIVSRVQFLYPEPGQEVFMLLPFLPAGIHKNQLTYQQKLLQVGKERHLGIIEAASFINSGKALGRNNELADLTLVAQSNLSKGVAKALDNSRRRKLIVYTFAGILILLLVFIMVQLKTRNRLKKLIAISTA